MSDATVFSVLELGFPWTTFDPFLFCVHHLDEYPAGNDDMGPAASLEGRDLGMDFAGKDGWRMYHGRTIPGFPRHPHRGFETVTLARQGFIDHADSLGATARFGQGDVQWMTAGRGIVHSEMFPLIRTDGPNTAEVFQIWLNLARADKMVEPHFTMLWGRDIPTARFIDEVGLTTRVTVVAGSLQSDDTVLRAPPPPPNSWAARAGSELCIFTITMEPGARFTLPPTDPEVNRTLYFFVGDELHIGDHRLPHYRGARLVPERPTHLRNGEQAADILLLQGRPIGEPVAHHGPFVMNRPHELQQAFFDYQRTQFGGWPWRRDDPVHPRDAGRFAIHADGREERIPVSAASSGPAVTETGEKP